MSSSSGDKQLAINRSFLYGHGLFESMRLSQGKIPLLSLHLDRLYSSLKSLDLICPPGLLSKASAKEMLMDYCQQEKLGEEAIIRLTVFSNSSGAYQADTKETAFHIKHRKTTKTFGQLNEIGWRSAFFETYKKDEHFLANHKLTNALFYVEAARWAQTQGIEEAIVCNSKEHPIEGNSSCLFVFKGDHLITPPLSEGCIDGIMRKLILTVSLWLPFHVEERPLTKQDIEEAQEVFLCNAAKGIAWIEEIEGHQYGHQKTIEVNEALSNYIDSLMTIC